VGRTLEERDLRGKRERGESSSQDCISTCFFLILLELCFLERRVTEIWKGNWRSDLRESAEDLRRKREREKKREKLLDEGLYLELVEYVSVDLDREREISVCFHSTERNERDNSQQR